MASERCPACGNPVRMCVCPPPSAKKDPPAPSAPSGDGSSLPKSASKSFNIGSSLNTLKSPQARTRSGFWNVQNFTADLVQQGKLQISEKIDSARNQIRMEFIADVVVGLRFESIVLLEMGSDAEGFLARMVELINARAPADERTWGSDISVDNGKAVEAPKAPFVADLTSWGSVSDRIWALGLALDYFTIHGAVVAPSTPRAHLAAHLSFAAARGRVLAWTSLLDYGDDDDGFVLDHAAIGAALGRDNVAEHLVLFNLFTGKQDPTTLGTENRLALVHYLVVTRSRITLAPRDAKPITTDGPLHALRILGVLAGRYEKYGILRQRHAEVFLFHSLVETPLQAVGRPTNSRAAWSFSIPLQGTYVPAYVIHSMWTPADGDDDDALADESAQDLRVETLVAQAEAARKEFVRPVIIAGDTNVDRKHLAALNKGMAGHGYSRRGEVTSTTLRTEKTIRTAPPGDVAQFLSEPYDAVYFDDEQEETLDCAVAYPDWTDNVLIGAYLNQMVNSAAVQQWYVELLKTAFDPIAFRVGRKGKHAGLDAITLALAPFKGEPATIGDYVARMNALRAAKLPPAGKSDHLLKYVSIFVDLDVLQPRTFLLFHRRFISDHRVVLIDLATEGYLGPKYVPTKGSASADLSGSSAKAGGQAAPPALDDGAAGQLTPGGGARVACLSQVLNTCGVRAAYNCLWLAGIRAGTHADLWGAFAPPVAPAAQIFNVNHAVDVTEDQVETVLRTVGHDVNVPVVGQFLYYDAMVAGILPRNVGATRLAQYRGQVVAWRAALLAPPPAFPALPPPPPPAPRLHLVLHTGAQQRVHQQSGIGHYFAVEVTATPGAYTFRYADSLNGAPDRTALVQAFIARYLP